MLMWIFLGVWCLTLCAAQPNYTIYPDPLSVRCQQDYCLVTYDNYRNLQTEYQTWEAAVQKCRDQGMSLAFVQSAEAQELLNIVVNDLPDSNTEDVWLGGHTTDDNTWRYISGTTFSEDTSVFASPIIPKAYCAFGEVLDDQVKYTMDECRETNGGFSILCQTPEFHSQGCNGGYSVSGQCLTKEDGDGLDWFSARQMCLQKNGDLPQIVFSDFPGAVQYLGQYYKFWMGIRRNPWKWRTKGHNDVEMYYYNWRPASDPRDGETNCMTFNRETNGQWKFRACTGALRYFICTNSTDYISTTSLAPSSSPATTTSPSSVNEVTTKPTMGSKNIIYYMIPLIVVGVLVAVLVPVIVCYMRKRRQKQTDDTRLHTYENQPNNKSPDDDVTPYSTSIPISATHDDVIDPYAEFTPGPIQSENINKSADQKPAKTPAKPKKKGKGRSEEAVEVPHIKTDGGDMYALSTNDARLKGGEGEVTHKVSEEGNLYALPMKQ